MQTFKHIHAYLLVYAIWFVFAFTINLSHAILPDSPPPNPAANAETGFDASLAAQLSPERRARLDVEFFNEFGVKGEFPTGGRVNKIREMAKEGFEVAYLADKLYNLPRGGFPSFQPDVLYFLGRLKQLAELGDPSAQCLFSHTAAEYRSFNQDPPTRYDLEVLAPRYRKAAADQAHPYCSLLWAGDSGEKDAKKISELALRCAKAGATICQKVLASRYRNGLGLPKDSIRGLCWLMQARNGNSAPSIESSFQFYREMLQKQISSEKMAKALENIASTKDCDTLTIQ